MKRYMLTLMIAALFCFALCSAAAADIDRSFETEHLREINARRAAAGLAPVFLSETLSQAARIRAKEIMTDLSHTRPNGTSCFSVLQEVSSYMFASYAENIAGGPETALSAVTSFMNSERHKTNILSPNLSRVGLATYIPEPDDANLSGYRTYWVEMFADSAPDSVTPGATSGGVRYGADQMWKQGGGATGVTIVVAVPKSGLLGVSFDGADLHEANYTVASADAPYQGSTSVTLLKRYLDYVRPGTHTVAFATSPDIKASTTVTAVSTLNDFSSAIETKDLSWKAGMDDMKISVRGADIFSLAAVICDGRALTSGAEYTAEQSGTAPGSKVLNITLTKNYLAALDARTHTLTLAFTDGYAETTFKITGSGESDGTRGGGSGSGCAAVSPAFAAAVAAIMRRRR